jgi:hypothetical protein
MAFACRPDEARVEIGSGNIFPIGTPEKSTKGFLKEDVTTKCAFPDLFNYFIDNSQTLGSHHFLDEFLDSFVFYDFIHGIVGYDVQGGLGYAAAVDVFRAAEVFPIINLVFAFFDGPVKTLTKGTKKPAIRDWTKDELHSRYGRAAYIIEQLDSSTAPGTSVNHHAQGYMTGSQARTFAKPLLPLRKRNQNRTQRPWFRISSRIRRLYLFQDLI